MASRGRGRVIREDPLDKVFDDISEHLTPEMQETFEEQIQELHRKEEQLIRECPEKDRAFLSDILSIEIPDPTTTENAGAVLQDKLQKFLSTHKMALIRHGFLTLRDWDLAFKRLDVKDFFDRLNKKAEESSNPFLKIMQLKGALFLTLAGCAEVLGKAAENSGYPPLTNEGSAALSDHLHFLKEVSGITALTADVKYLHSMINRVPPKNFTEKVMEIVSHAMLAFMRAVAHIRFDWKVSAKAHEDENDTPALNTGRRTVVHQSRHGTGDTPAEDDSSAHGFHNAATRLKEQMKRN